MKEILDLLKDDDRVRDERKKARRNRDKLAAVPAHTVINNNCLPPATPPSAAPSSSFPSTSGVVRGSCLPGRTFPDSTGLPLGPGGRLGDIDSWQPVMESRGRSLAEGVIDKMRGVLPLHRKSHQPDER